MREFMGHAEEAADRRRRASRNSSFGRTGIEIQEQRVHAPTLICDI